MKITTIVISLLCSGMLAGNEFAVAMFVHPALYRVPDEPHARVAKPLARNLGRYMPFWYAASLLLAIGQLLVVETATLSWRLSLAAVILLAVIVVFSIVLLVPINNQVAQWDLGRLPANWLGLRRRWDAYHRIRVLLLVIVLLLLVISALLWTRR